MCTNIWQCCYTNTESRKEGVLKTGWGEVAFSDEIPRDAFEKCSLYQSSNSGINPLSEDITEIFGDGKYIYIMKSIYGLQDYAGRPNMFSHAYIMQWDNGLVTNPNRFLCIGDMNFLSSEKEAEENKNNLDKICNDMNLSLKVVLNNLELDKNKYATLIKSVYVQFTDKFTVKPLYIQYDGRVDNMIKLLYCIYMGLPFEIRKNLKVASTEGNNSGKTNIIFSKEAYKKSCYINPFTAENNILKDRDNLRLKRLGYVDYAVRNMDNEDDINGFFCNLGSMAESYGKTGFNEYLYRLSFFFNDTKLLQTLDIDEVQDLVDIIFNEANTETEKVQLALANILRILKDNNSGLYSNNEDKLISLLGKDSSNVLGETAHDYFVFRISAMSAERAERFLKKFSPEDAEVYRAYMIQNVNEHDEETINESNEDTQNALNEADDSKINEALNDKKTIVSEALYLGLKEKIIEFRKEYSDYNDDEILECINYIFNEINGEVIDEDTTEINFSEKSDEGNSEKTENEENAGRDSELKVEGEEFEKNLAEEVKKIE